VSQADPEIFAIFQSKLTPYLQTKVGGSLRAYTLEIDYSPGNNDNAGQGVVVTNLQVSSTLKLVSNNIESLKNINHDLVTQWIHDFFNDPDSVTEVIDGLQGNNIHVNEIVVSEQQGDASATISQINSGTMEGGSIHANGINGVSEDDGKNGAMIGVMVAVLTIGAVLLVHFTGRFPSREQLGEVTLSLRDTLRSYGFKAQSDDDDDSLGDIHNIETGGKKQRNRTWSGTFRRYPTGGIRPAAIQRSPAQSSDYLGDSSSKSSSSASKRSSMKDQKSINETSTLVDDYTFSVADDYNVGMDYGPVSPRSPMTPSHRPSSANQRSSFDEFSMPDDYDTVHEDQGSLYSKWSQNIKRPRAKQYPRQHPAAAGSFTMSPLTSPRRVTPSDIVSPQTNGRMDEWSLASFDVKSPSNRQLYRDFDGSTKPSLQSSESKSSPSSKHGLSMPRFI